MARCWPRGCALAGHTVKLVCLPAEADLINSEGFRVRMPVKGRDGLVEIDSRRLPGKVSAAGADAVEPAEYDLVALAMQEPQYARVRRARVAACGRRRQGAVHVDHEHAAAAVPRPHSRACGRRVAGLLHRSNRVGCVRSGVDDAVQSRPAGLPPARRKSERPAGQPADQFQGGALRLRRAHVDAASTAIGYRGPADSKPRMDPSSCR